MTEYYLPHITKPNGNCLFNMISISLIGNDSFSQLLRALTVYTIIYHKNDFIEIIKKDILFTNLTEENVNKKFNEILYEARTNKIWCNEYHLLAISTFLNCEIYIYSTFYNNITGALFQNASNAEELENIFIYKIRTGAHLIYKPLPTTIVNKNNINPIYGFFSSSRKHYVSVISHSENNPEFKPTNCILNWFV